MSTETAITQSRSALRRFSNRVADRLRHPSYVDTVYRARCECGWTGPIRDWDVDAHDDRAAHWRCVAQSGSNREQP